MNLRRPRLVLVVVAGLLTLTACTPLEIALYQRAAAPYQNVLSDERLARLRNCESSGNYEAVSSTGRYRGAYQFSQSRWNSLAAKYFPWLQGVDPAVADPRWQDLMARALWGDSGPVPWPTCGEKV